MGWERSDWHAVAKCNLYDLGKRSVSACRGRIRAAEIESRVKFRAVSELGN